MANLIDIIVPDVGGEEVEVIELCVTVGEAVDAEASIVTVESDKASMDIPCTDAGTIKSLKVKVGDKIKQGDVLGQMESGAAASEPEVPAAAEDKAPETEDDKSEAPEAEDAKSEAPVKSAAAPSGSKTIDVTVPDIGDATEVDIIELLVAVGDIVEPEDGLITLETDKATMDVPAPEAGKIVSLAVKVGDKVSKGSLVLTLEVAGSASDESDSEPTPVAAPATDPAPSEPAPVKASQASASQAPAPQAPKAPPVPHHPSAGDNVNTGKVHASPSVRRLAREFGVDLTQVQGTGRKNRVQKDDVQSFVKYELSRPKMNPGSSAGSGNTGGGLQVLAQPKVDFAKFGEIEEVPLTRIQKLSGPNLHRNWVTIPHVTQFDEADITDLETFRKEQNAIAEKRKLGVKITPLVFMMKAVADGLKEYPAFNSSLSESGESLVMKKYYHIGIAVDTPGGLMVPVVRDVDKKGIMEISRELMEISAKARDGKLKATDMQGSCFTISSLGGIGGTAFTPIVNAPDVAILGVSKSEMKPKWNGKEFEPRLMLPLSLSYDHRVIDGALAARFSVHVSGALSDLRRILL
ncbi:dihydrolipoyllysine-residue acetyltransferase [Brumicola pallidula]|jgi:pyruvate dehydrogenase E2 component (dihydrolipoamide acetyltransferase)|uniref:Acetyltransferase component of pyruvate dehydrogenase complex n=1 Tax=Brumicola pallidula DSM 14239 = ACAM 615 TaxID=1121922 RepID=K6ZKQ3_9ALTE|nr:dihydrolipoyllysine-residue acetyltransferase [Glaciecola pallidula]GAC30897.1 pyruvate dehydrogenase E2 component [Glaciecola pallidula DSM 14239 = ACAM 615]